MVLEKTLESSLDCKEIQPVHSEGDQPWGFFGRNDAKAETPVLWLTHEKSWLIGKNSDAGSDWGQEEKGTTEDDITGWHHWLDGHESEWTPGDGDEHGGLACCDSCGHKESDMTEWLNWTELKDSRRLKAGGEGDDRGWDGWIASPTQCTWVWANSRKIEGQGSLVCCSPQGHKESEQRLSKWTATKDSTCALLRAVLVDLGVGKGTT